MALVHHRTRSLSGIGARTGSLSGDGARRPRKDVNLDHTQLLSQFSRHSCALMPASPGLSACTATKQVRGRASCRHAATDRERGRQAVRQTTLSRSFRFLMAAEESQTRVRLSFPLRRLVVDTCARPLCACCFSQPVFRHPLPLRAMPPKAMRKRAARCKRDLQDDRIRRK